MVAPYDYTSQFRNTGGGGFLEGLTIGAQREMERRAQEQARLQQEQALKEQEETDRLVDEFAANPNLSTLAKLSSRVSKDQFSAFQGVFESKSKEEQRSQMFHGAQVMNAFIAKKPEIASSLLRQRAQAIGEDTPEGQSYLQIADMAESDPDAALGMVATTMAIAPGSKEYLDRVFAVQALPMAERKTELEIKELEQKLKNANAQAASETGQSVQSSKILDDGTAISVMRDGSTVVRKPDGAVATGAEATAAIRAAQDYGSDLQRLREQSRVTGREVTKVGIDQGRTALETIPKIRSNISNLQRAKELVKQGAETGAIAERFPSWRASTIELLNLRNQLGIDVINSATFGALSESELELALQTALPTKMDQKELESWLDRKIVAQEKLANHLEDAALFFLNGGSAADWVEMQRKQRQESEGAAPATPAAPTPVAPLPAATPAPMQFQFKGVKGASQ